MTHLLIVEPQAGGHRMHYVRHVATAAVARGWRVSIATWPESISHPSFKQLEMALPNAFGTLLMSRSRMPDELLRQGAGFRQQLAFHRTCADLYRSLSGDELPSHVFVPFLNNFDKIVPFLGSPFGRTPWSGIVMRDTFHHEAMGIPGRRRRSDVVKKWLFLRLASNQRLRALFTIDEALPEFLERYHLRAAERVVFVPDPVQMPLAVDRGAVRTSLGIDESSVVVLVFGTLDQRKQVDAVIAAMKLPACPDSVVLLIAGRQTSEIERLVGSADARKLAESGRLVQINEYLSAEQEADVFAAADIIWVGYRDHYTMSGVLLQAAASELPVIACREGLIGWLTQRHRAGCVVEAADYAMVATALSTLAASPELRREFGSRGSALARRHSVAAFAERILQSAEPRLA